MSNIRRIPLKDWNIERNGNTALLKIRGSVVAMLLWMSWQNDFSSSYLFPTGIMAAQSGDTQRPSIWLYKGHIWSSPMLTMALDIQKAGASRSTNYQSEFSVWWDQVSPEARVALEVMDRTAQGLSIPKDLMSRYLKGGRTSVKNRLELVNSVKHSRHIPQWVKIHVVIRDRGCCVKCGCNDSRLLEFDHLIPFSLGGPSDDPDNIRLLCIACNRSKGAGMEVGV